MATTNLACNNGFPLHRAQRKAEHGLARSREIADGVVVDFDTDGNVVGIDVEHASTKLDLARALIH